MPCVLGAVYWADLSELSDWFPRTMSPCFLNAVNDPECRLANHDGGLLQEVTPVHPLPRPEVVTGIVVLLSVELPAEQLRHGRVDRVEPAEVVSRVASRIRLLCPVHSGCSRCGAGGRAGQASSEHLQRRPGGRAAQPHPAQHPPPLLSCDLKGSLMVR